MMYKENLFSLIRKEEVIIWAGAGLSMYAGFPTGKRLGEILIEHLSNSEREMINDNLLLPDLAEEFYRLKGSNRNSLIRILKQTFSNIEPISTECHDNLAIIPHIKSIITTNYDTLIEDAYKSEAQVAISTKHIPYLEKNKTHVYKVHGDLSDPESIIITKSDYNKFFKSNTENDVYWTSIKDKLSTKNVLFLGYSLEDPNVTVIFDRITDALGENRKEAFLVSPNLPKHKIDYLAKKGIHYINESAEQLIEDLLQNIKENIIEDLEKGETSADTFRDFLTKLDLLPSLRANKKNYKLQSLKGANEDVEGKINFSIKNDPAFIKELNEFVSGDKIGDFEISEDMLSNVGLWYGGLKFPSSEPGKLKLRIIPKINTSIDIRFDDGSEFTDVPIKLYVTTSAIEVHVELKSANLIVKVDKSTSPTTKYNITYEHKEICRNVKDEIELFTFLKNLGEGKQFTTFAKTGESYSHTFSVMPPLLNESLTYLDYFINLKVIEQNFNIRFSDIKLRSITQSTYNKILTIIAVINGEKLEYDSDEEISSEIIGDADETIKELQEVNRANVSLVIQYKVEEVVELHGQNINLGYKHVKLVEPYILNLEAIIHKQEQIVKVRSKKNKMKVTYFKSKI